MKPHLLISMIFAYLIGFSMVTEASVPDRYEYPKSVISTLKLKSNTNSTVTLRLEVKSVLGNISNVRLTARLSGFNQVAPIPSEKTFDKINEGESQYLDFILPTTKEILNSNIFKIRGIIEYTPDYDAIINQINENAENKYENPTMREDLIDEVSKCSEKALKSVESIRYFPDK